MPCRFASSGTVATSRSASRAILALNVASNFLRDFVISVLHPLRQSRTLHTLTFGPISGVHFRCRAQARQTSRLPPRERRQHPGGKRDGCSCATLDECEWCSWACWRPHDGSSPDSTTQPNTSRGNRSFVPGQICKTELMELGVGSAGTIGPATNYGIVSVSPAPRHKRMAPASP